MYRKIMVPVDLQHVEKIDKSLSTAADLARVWQATVCYVAVSGRAPNRVAPNPEKFEVEMDMFAREQCERFGIETEYRVVSSVDVPVELDDKLLVRGFSVALWLPLVLRRLGWGAVVLILGGGAAYVLGTIVFASCRPRLSPRLFGYHELFHVPVMVGAGLHFWAIAAYVG